MKRADFTDDTIRAAARLSGVETLVLADWLQVILSRDEHGLANRVEYVRGRIESALENDRRYQKSLASMKP